MATTAKRKPETKKKALEEPTLEIEKKSKLPEKKIFPNHIMPLSNMAASNIQEWQSAEVTIGNMTRVTGKKQRLHRTFGKFFMQ